MRERPILFSGPMVRAILEGRKTQTRRVIKPVQPRADGRWPAGRDPVPDCPFGAVGDRLWVRETWSADCLSVYPCPRAWYRADRDFDEGDVRMHDDCSPPRECKRGPSGDCLHGFRWRPSIHMPRWASRLLLEITEVRVQQIQEISEEDARAEGAFFTDYGRHCFHAWDGPGPCPAPDAHHGQKDGWSMVKTKRSSQCLGSARMAFANYWLSLNGPDSWAANPWVWCVSFKRIEKEGRS